MQRAEYHGIAMGGKLYSLRTAKDEEALCLLPVRVKLGKDELVSMDVIMRICDMLECDVGDIMEMIPDERF